SIRSHGPLPHADCHLSRQYPRSQAQVDPRRSTCSGPASAHAHSDCLPSCPLLCSLPAPVAISVLVRRLPIENTPPVRPNIDPSVNSWVTRNLQHQSPLVLVVVDPDPRPRLVIRSEYPALPLHGP